LKDLSLVTYKEGRPYIDELYFSKKYNKIIRKNCYGKILRCKECNNIFFSYLVNIKNGRGLYCSKECINKYKNNPNWKGGEVDSGYGYLMVLQKDHPYRNNRDYVMKHRIIVEKYIGRYLKSNEVVHHVNKNKKDNRIKNLMVFNNDGAHRNFDKGCNINKKYIVFDFRRKN